MAPAVVQENLIVTFFLNVPLPGEIVGVSTVADGVGVGVGVTEGVGLGVGVGVGDEAAIVVALDTFEYGELPLEL